MDQIITMDHGSGGLKTASLIDEIIRPVFSNEALDILGDGAVVPIGSEKAAFSTDSFVISPYEFPGGDIGHLSVCGTVNDLAMCGAIPQWMSFSLILEEGFPIDDLKKIVESAGRTAEKAGVKIVTGDTKVVEKGSGDGIYINTAGIGRMDFPYLSADRITQGDHVLINGTVGDHGASIMLSRHPELLADSEIKSDSMPLNHIAKALWDTLGKDLHMLRDATRGGVATTLNEFTKGHSFGIELIEDNIPIRKDVSAFLGLLGIDPLYSANEGKMLMVMSKDAVPEALRVLKSTEGGENACDIGIVTDSHKGYVTIRNSFGGQRILNTLTGAVLPRIC